jgi:hypothetical protein
VQQKHETVFRFFTPRFSQVKIRAVASIWFMKVLAYLVWNKEKERENQVCSFGEGQVFRQQDEDG